MGVLCQPPMVRLLSLCPYVDYATASTRGLADFDVHAPLMSVPSIIGMTLAALPREPYLAADTATIDQWRPALRESARRQ